jgi:hypothetical protein
MNHEQDIFTYIRSQENSYKNPIAVNDKWDWSMKDHIETSVLYTNSQLNQGKTDFTPVKNITRPILNLQHRTEDIEVKDVQIYVDEPDRYHLSFLVKKYHDDVFTQENNLDTFIDDLNISRIDFGGGLSKQLDSPCPEVVPLQSIAFCDQTDILSGPIGIKHYYSPDQLLDMGKVGWGKESNGATISLEDLIMLSREEKKTDTNHSSIKTPGRYIEIYEVHGNLPKFFADEKADPMKYETRLFIVAFYQKKNGGESGVILYTAPEKKSPFKLIKRDPIYGRALGWGGAEELFEPQVWVNYDMIRMQDMLDAASKTILKTTDPELARRNDISSMKNLEVVELGAGMELDQVDTFPRNLKLFEDSVSQWEVHAQQMGAANDSIMGEQPASGTPFKLQELVTQESHGLHEYRRQQYAKHLEEIYRDWIIPHIQKKICEGARFLSELSLEELQFVTDAVVTTQTNQRIKEIVLAGGTITPDQVDVFKGLVLEQFKKKGTKHFIEILKGEFADTDLGVKVSVAGKSKNLSGMVDKLTNIFRTIVANPYILQAPPIAKLFNKIIEASGLDPIDLSNFNVPPLPTRRITTNINYADVGATQPNPEQQEILQLSGVQPPQGQSAQAPAQPQQTPTKPMGKPLAGLKQ